MMETTKSGAGRHRATDENQLAEVTKLLEVDG